MRYIRLALPLLFVTLAIGGAQASELGKTLAGENCALANPVSSSDPVAITCGGAPSGTLRLASLGAPPSGAARAGALAASVRAFIATADVTCSPDIALDADTQLLFCTTGGTAWPRLVLVRATPKGIFVADGLPGMAPVLANAIASESGATLPVAAIIGRVQGKFRWPVSAAPWATMPARKAPIAMRWTWNPGCSAATVRQWRKPPWNWRCRSATSRGSTRPAHFSAAPHRPSMRCRRPLCGRGWRPIWRWMPPTAATMPMP
jgi:hypothetical protein